MKIVDTKQSVVDLSGKPLRNGEEVLSVGVVLSTILAGRRTVFDAMKAWTLALRFHNDPSVELDEADMEKLKQAVETDETFVSLVRGQVVHILSNL